MARDMCVATAAVRLMLHYPFWCELYYTMKVIESYAIKTLATDGKRLWVNPDFFNPLSLEYKIAALAHEVCHKMLHHCTRGRGCDPIIANIAMDIVVNTMLHDNGFKIHPNWVQPEAKYRGWTFEAIYHDLIKQYQQPQPQPQPGQSGQAGQQGQQQAGKQPSAGGKQGKEDGQQAPKGGGKKDGGKQGAKADKGQAPATGAGAGQGDQDGTDAVPGAADQDGASGFCDGPGIPDKYAKAWKDVIPFRGSAEEIEAFEEKVDQQVQQAIATAKAMGHAPAGVEMAMAKVMKVAEERWFDHLHRFFQSLRMAEFDWKRINRRMAMKHHVIAPTQYTERLGDVVLFIDASGSCYDVATQAGFTSHVNAILSEAQPRRCIVAHFDTRVHKHEEVDPGSLEFEGRPAGGGGTSFTDLLPWMEREGIVPEVVIILTDMYDTFPQEEPDYPVIWASTSPNMVAPVGETIYIGPHNQGG